MIARGLRAAGELFPLAVLRMIEHAVARAPDWQREDARQEALFACWRALPRFDAARGVSLRSYLDWAAHGAVLDYMRAMGDCSRSELTAIRAGTTVRQARVPMVCAANVPARVRSPEGASVDAELWRHVEALPAEQAVVLLGLYREEWEGTEAAARLGMGYAHLWIVRRAALDALRAVYRRAA